MKPRLTALAALFTVGALVGAPLSAQAGITFISYGVALPSGESLITDFSTAAGLSSGAYLTTGSAGGVTAAPAFSATTVDTAQYLSVPGGGSVTLSFAPTKELSVYLGSLDSYNTLTLGFGGGSQDIVTGSQLGAISGASNGNQTAADTNGRFVFTFAAPVSSATFASSTNAFEVADVAGVAGVPEPVSWALMIVGIGGVGASLRGSRGRRALALG